MYYRQRQLAEYEQVKREDASARGAQHVTGEEDLANLKLESDGVAEE